MELIPLVKLTLIVFSSAVAIFIVGSFIIYKLKEMLSGGGKKENPYRRDRSNTAKVPTTIAPKPTVHNKPQQQAPVQMQQNVMHPQNPALMHQIAQRQPIQQQPPVQMPPQYPHYPQYPVQQPVYGSEHQYPTNAVQYLKRKATQAPEHSYYRTSRTQSRVYQQIVRSRRDRIQVVNNQPTSAQRVGAINSAKERPFYHPRTTLVDRSAHIPQAGHSYGDPNLQAPFQYSTRNEKLRKLTIIR